MCMILTNLCFFLWICLFFVCFFYPSEKTGRRARLQKWNPLLLLLFSPLRGRRLVSHGDRPRPLAPGGPQGADGGDGRGHAGPLRQLGLGQQLPASLQRHGPGLEAVPARGRRRGKYPHQVCVTIKCGFSRNFSNEISQDGKIKCFIFKKQQQQSHFQKSSQATKD